MGTGTISEKLRVSAARRGRLAEVWNRLFDATVQKGTLSLIDQGVVSGTSFVTTVIIGRMCGPGSLGVYSLAFTFTALTACVQEALISLPYVVYGNRLRGKDRAECAGSSLIHCAALAALAIVCLAVVGAIFSAGFGPPQVAPVIWILTAIIPVLMLREFVRRMAFAHLNVSTALVLDAVAATLQIGGLLLLAATGTLSVVGAYAVIGVACAVTGLAWLWRSRNAFVPRREQVVKDAVRNWLFGRWVFATALVVVSRGYAVPWMLALMLGAKATGVFVACETVILLSNPFVLGMGNVLAPMASRALASGGRSGVRRVVRKTGMLVVGAMVAFCGLAIVFGGEFVRLLYGSEYAGNDPTISVLAIALLVTSLAMTVRTGLFALERPDVNFKAGAWGLAAMAIVALCLIDELGVLGAAFGLLAESVVTTSLTYLGYRSIVTDDSTEAGTERVLRDEPAVVLADGAAKR